MSNEPDRIDHLAEQPGVFTSVLEGLLKIRQKDLPELIETSPEG